MKKRIMPIILAIIVSLSTQMPAFAYGADSFLNTDNTELDSILSTIDIKTEIENAQEGRIDEGVEQSILDRIEVGTTNGESEVGYTVRKLGTMNATKTRNINGADSSNVYAVTATQKTTSNSATGYGMESYLTMVWMDNPGPGNQILQVYGNWVPNGYTIRGRMVDYGIVGINSQYIGNDYEVKSPTVNTFFYRPSKDLIGLSLQAWSTVVNEPSDFAKDALYCKVKPTIFN